MTTPDKVACEIFIAMNEDGGWIVTNDGTEAMSDLVDHEGGYVCRVVKITVNMTPPVVTEVAAIDVPDDAGTTSETPDTEVIAS